MAVARSWHPVVLALLFGCGTSANVVLQDGRELEGKIVRADDETIYLDDGGESIGVRRGEVAEIDHPGNVLATIGALITAYGLYNIMVAAPHCSREGNAYCLGVFAPAAVGLPMLIAGGSVFGGSVWAMQPPTVKPGVSRLQLSPIFAVAGRGFGPGLAVAGDF